MTALAWAQSSVVQPVRSDTGLYGFADASGNTVVAPRYTAVGAFDEEGYAWVNVNGKFDESGTLIGGLYGYVDRTGREVIPATYQFVGELHDGICWVAAKGKIYEEAPSVSEEMNSLLKLNEERNTEVSSDMIKQHHDHLVGMQCNFKRSVNGIDIAEGKFGYASVNGKVILEPKYPNIANRFHDGMAWVSDGKNVAYINSEGRFKTPFIYEILNNVEIMPTLINWAKKGPVDMHFKNGFAVVGRKEKKMRMRFGYLNKNGMLISSSGEESLLSSACEYIDAYPFTDNGFAKVKVSEAEGYKLIDRNGKAITQGGYDDFFEFADGLTVFSKKSALGYVDAQGKEISAPIFVMASPFENGVARVAISTDNLGENGRGKSVVGATASSPLKYKAILTTPWHLSNAKLAPDATRRAVEDGTLLEHSYAAVDTRKTLGNDKKASHYMALIDKQGVAITDFVYTRIGKEFEGLRAAQTEEGAGWIDNEGNRAVDFDTYKNVGGFSEGVAVAQLKNGKCGCVDKENNTVVEFKYDRMEFHFKNGIVAAMSDNKWGAIDRSGNVVIPFVCNSDMSLLVVRRNVFEAKGCKPVTERDVEIYWIHQHNISHHFSINDTITDEEYYWDF